MLGEPCACKASGGKQLPIICQLVVMLSSMLPPGRIVNPDLAGIWWLASMI